MNLREQLIELEGWEHKAYPDPLTKGAPYTIGAGHCGPEVRLGLEWTDEQIAAALDADIEAKMAEVEKRWPWAKYLCEPRRAVLIGMAFQMGTVGLGGFKDFLGACAQSQFAKAAVEMLRSRWARQTPARANRLSRQMESGRWEA